MPESESINVELDTPIGVAAAKSGCVHTYPGAGRYAINCVKVSGRYAAATDGKILGLRMLAKVPEKPHSCLIPPKAGTPGRVTNWGNIWSTQAGRRKPKITPGEDLSEKPFPPVADVLPKPGKVRWARLDGKLLARIAQAIGHGELGGDKCQDLYLGIDEEVRQPIRLLAGDLRGVGLIMPRTSRPGSATWTQKELSCRFEEFCTTFKKETK